MNFVQCGSSCVEMLRTTAKNLKRKPMPNKKRFAEVLRRLQDMMKKARQLAAQKQSGNFLSQMAALRNARTH